MVDMLVHEWNHRIDELVSNCEWGVAAKCDKGTKSFEITIFDAASLFMRPLLEISPGLRSPELAIVVRTLRNSLKFFKIGILDMIMLNLKKIEICIQIDHPFSCLINSGERYDHLWTVVKWDLACEYLSEVVPVIDGYDGVKSSYLSYIANDNSYLEKFCRYLLTLDCTSALPFYKCLLYLVNSTESLRTIVVSIEEWQKVRRIDDCELVPLLGAVLNLPLDIFQDDDTVNFRAKITSGLVKCTEPDLLRDYIPFLQVLKHIDSTLFMSILKKCEKQYPHIATECSIRDCLSRDSHTRLIAARGLAIREVDVDIISNLFAAITIPVEVPVDYSGLEGLTMAECRDKALILSSNLRDIDQFKHLLGILHFSLKPENLKVFSEFMEVIVSNLLMSFATLYQKGQVPFALLRCLVLLALHSPRSRKAMRDKTDFSYLLIQLCINKSIFFRLECGKLLSMLLLDVDSTSVKEVLDIIDLESTGAVIIPTSLTEKYIPFGVLRIVNRESIFESVLVSNSLILDSCKCITS